MLDKRTTDSDCNKLCTSFFIAISHVRKYATLVAVDYQVHVHGASE
jgi:hypothetical protein